MQVAAETGCRNLPGTVAGNDASDVERVEFIDGLHEAFGRGRREVKAADEGCDAFRSGQFGNVPEGVDDTGMAASGNKHQSVTGFEPDRQVVFNRIRDGAFRVEKERSAGVFV